MYYVITTNKSKNIETAKALLESLGINAEFSGYSDANGVSVYFYYNGFKLRVSNHSVTSIHRLQNEFLFYFDAKTIGLGGKTSFKSNKGINTLKAREVFSASQAKIS